jgi:hypothetical protein
MPCARGVDAWSASRLLTAPVLPGNWLDGSPVIGIAEVHTHAAYLTRGDQNPADLADDRDYCPN